MVILTFILLGFEIFEAITRIEIDYILFLKSLTLGLIAPILFIKFNLEFRKYSKIRISTFKIIKIIVVGILANIILSIGISFILFSFIKDVPPNGASEGFLMNPIFTLLIMAWSLFGEEAIKLSLFFLFYGNSSYVEENKKSYWLAWLGSSVIFGLLHLSTYGYNFIHCTLIIGLPSVLYGYFWKRTESPLVLWATHLGYNATLLSLIYLISKLLSVM